MRPQQAEARVRALIAGSLASGRSVEDSLVEFKAEPTDPYRAARQLAGHANAARGEPILWVFGFDEKGRTFHRRSATDIAQWWDQVRKHFDSVAPRLDHDIEFDIGDHPIRVFSFETEQFPYVIKVRQGDRIPEFEIVWRTGTQARTAGRAEILEMTVRRTTAPRIQVVRLEGQIQPDRVRVTGRLLVYADWGTATYYPEALRSITLRGFTNSAEILSASLEGFVGETTYETVGPTYSSLVGDRRYRDTQSFVWGQNDGVYVSGPGTLPFDVSHPARCEQTPDLLRFKLEMVDELGRTVTVDESLVADAEAVDDVLSYRWESSEVW